MVKDIKMQYFNFRHAGTYWEAFAFLLLAQVLSRSSAG